MLRILLSSGSREIVVFLHLPTRSSLGLADSQEG
jgi:hypothetical protein